MEEWKCTFSTDSSFIVGRVYSAVPPLGSLIDEEKRRRLPPHLYREHYRFIRHYPIQENE